MVSRPAGDKPAWALAIKRRREEQVGSQEEMALRANISQSLISQIERGIQNPTGISVERFARILETLEWTAAEFTQATGLQVGFEPTTPELPFAPPISPAFPMRSPERPILPAALKAAVTKLAGVYPQLTDEVAWRMLPRGYDGGPLTEEDWIEFLTDNIKWFR